jgi:hypothetical protein
VIVMVARRRSLNFENAIPSGISRTGRWIKPPKR